MISFGPVPSRRLGMSLGINNIVAPKTCSYSCIYCQVGKTKTVSITRESFYEPEVIFKKVRQHLKKLEKDKYPDYITFVSNGEPTLDINLGRSISLLKSIGIPVAVISNASLLFDESVRHDLNLADWVSLKMDAADNTTWLKVNRPSLKLNFEKHIENIFLFSSEYSGKLYTETMIIKGFNDTAGNFSGLAEMITKIIPDKAYLSIPTRPPAEKSAKTPDTDKLNLAWQIFNNRDINTELLTGFEGTNTGSTGNIYEDILNITAVHPLREDTMAELLEKDNANQQVVDSLIKQKLIRSVLYKGNKFYIREYHLNI
ncbi:MAG: radical SAM protein [Bacteroidales bacterium]|jgi:wyosine [tRNA(Phe)-imidazoG37] synthetase (radical SAM superfamily)|nr:radical SAM protein [Bacteroidales bacterium]